VVFENSLHSCPGKEKERRGEKIVNEMTGRDELSSSSGRRPRKRKRREEGKTFTSRFANPTRSRCNFYPPQKREKRKILIFSSAILILTLRIDPACCWGGKKKEGERKGDVPCR